MALIHAGSVSREIELMVFDKDGLMFQSQAFWSELGNERMRKLREVLPEKDVEEWAKLNGLTLENGSVVHTEPKGILATASPREECAVMAGFIVGKLSVPWEKGLSAARDVFLRADRDLSLARALSPRQGFPEILGRLRKAGIRYAVATSDTYERVLDSFALVGETPPELIVFPDMVEHGKPDPDMLFYLSEKSGVPLEKIAMVGDSYVDVKMAYLAGSLGIGVPETDEMREVMRPYTGCIVNSLDDILTE